VVTLLCIAILASINTISRNTEFYTHIEENTVKAISKRMLGMLERLAEMFPSSSYQTRLDHYLSSKGITDAAQLEGYIKQFNYNSHKENLV